MEAYITHDAPAPGTCALCATPDAPFLDLGIDYGLSVEQSRIGAVLICFTCFGMLADKMGYRNNVPVESTPTYYTDEQVRKISNDILDFGDRIAAIATELFSHPASSEDEDDGYDEDSGQDDLTASIEKSLGVFGDSVNESDTTELFSR